MTAELTVVIPTYQRPDLCRRSIASVRRVAEVIDVDIDLIVVEQGAEPSYSIPLDFSGRWLYSHRSGVSYARNLGLAHAETPYVIFVDDDAELLPGVSELLDAARQPGVDVVCGRMISSGGTTIRGTDRPRRIRPWNAFRLFVEPAAVWRTDSMNVVDGFDERLGPANRLGAEEGAGLLARLSRTPGGRQAFVPADVVVHPELGSTPDDKARRYGAGTSGLMVLAPGTWSTIYAMSSVTRRVGGVIRSRLRGDRAGVAHRRAWLRGFASGVRTARSLRASPRNTPAADVLVRVES
ncbi:glycosyltransferase family 2 protein [Ilumatobacter fluminis]|uniref:glycosyltransferase family 2 protein n=1 Tax=Ilumatobacter fluminis TaxID=467091 RepID=UPI001415131A|nr:glycosyltransferase family 2 protein [Ilumatobacter fluminis]